MPTAKLLSKMACDFHFGLRQLRSAGLCLAVTLVAAPAALAGDDAAGMLRTVRLLKPPHARTHFSWTAIVKEPGGQFLLGRGSQASFVPFYIGPANPAQRIYRVDIAPDFAASIHELRYRDSRGNEILLAAVLVECDVLETGMATVASSLSLTMQAVVDPGPALMAPALGARPPDADGARFGALRPAPTTPPPRRWLEPVSFAPSSNSRRVFL